MRIIGSEGVGQHLVTKQGSFSLWSEIGIGIGITQGVSRLMIVHCTSVDEHHTPDLSQACSRGSATGLTVDLSQLGIKVVSEPVPKEVQ